MKKEDAVNSISQSAIKRLPFYLRYLKEKKKAGVKFISTPQIALDLEKNAVQVKKDISHATKKSGKPKVGHSVDDLIQDIENFLGCNQTTNAVLVGAGHLGTALLSYKGFNDYGLKIIHAFDINETIVGKKINNVPIHSIKDLGMYCKKEHVLIGIIAVNEASAQEICDELVKSGIKAIWNFSPILLKVPEDVIIQSENMASGLAYLSRRLSEMLEKEQKLV